MFWIRNRYAIRRTYFQQSTRATDILEHLLEFLDRDFVRPDLDALRHLEPCLRCGRRLPPSFLQRGLCARCTAHAPSSTRASSSTACRSCGIRFSPNMLRDGMCNACRNPQGSEQRDETPPPQQPGSVSSIDLRTAYRILGCDETASPEEIRNLRRALVKECHSDRLPPEASRECVESANTRFREIQAAYEAVMASLKKPT